MTKKELRPTLDVYESQAQFWSQERARSSFFEIKYIQKLEMKLSAGAAVLDLGCGSGQPIAQYLIEKGFRVTGVDGAQAMIEIAKSKFPASEWICADMRNLNLQRKFQAVIAWDSFFHLTPIEQEKMFPVFAAHLDVGGILLFTSGPEKGEAIGAVNGEALYHSSFSPDEYRALMRQSGFKDLSFTPQDPEVGEHSVWIAQFEGKSSFFQIPQTE